MTDPQTSPDPFTLLGLEPRPWLDPQTLENRFTEHAAAAHPDQATDPLAKAQAAATSSALAEAYNLLKKTSSRLGLLLGKTSPSTSKVGAVPEPWATLLMQVGAWAARCDQWLAGQHEHRTALEKAMTLADGQRLLEEMNDLRTHVDQLEAARIAELKALDAAWPDANLVHLESLRQQFAFVEKVRAQMQERFLRLAEALL